MWLLFAIDYFLSGGLITKVKILIQFLRVFLIGLVETLCICGNFLFVTSNLIALFEFWFILFVLQEFCGFFNKVGRHFSLVITCDDSGPVVTHTLEVSKLERLVNWLGLEAIGRRVIFFITVVELVAIHPVRVFESLAIHVDVFYCISANIGHVRGVEPSITVNKGLRLKGT